MRTLLGIVVCSVGLNPMALAQWSTVGGGTDGHVRSILYDAQSERLYCFGHMLHAGDQLVNGTTFWDGFEWHPMGDGVTDAYGSGVVSAVQMPGSDSIWASGFFPSAINVPASRHLILWNGQQWRSIGPNGCDGIAWAMLCNEDGLTVSGLLDSVASFPFNGLARYAQGSWSALCAFPSNEGWYAYTAVAKYNGQYVFGGNINGVPGIKEIGVLVGDSLRPMGQGILGDSWVNSLIEYHGELYAGGEFHAASGNPSSCIMKWDGQQWSNPFPGVEFVNQVVDLDVRNDELFISGRATLPGDAAYYSLARYNGERICLFAKNINTTFTSIASTGTVLYAAPNMITLGTAGDTVNYLVRYDLSHPSDTCLALPTGITSLEKDALFRTYPNPTSGALNIEYDAARFGGRSPQFLVYDATGHSLDMSPSPRVHNGIAHLDLSEAGKGVRFVRIRSADGSIDHMCMVVVQ